MTARKPGFYQSINTLWGELFTACKCTKMYILKGEIAEEENNGK
jgi:hypothetical protein